MLAGLLLRLRYYDRVGTYHFMSLNRLFAIAPPPNSPVGAGSPSDWPDIEQRVGTKVPEDYKQFINAYGGGCFVNFLWVYSPFAPSWHIMKWRNEVLDAYRSAQKAFPQYAPPFPAFPSLGGLLPWGQTDNGDCLFWLTTGRPVTWTVVVCDSKYSEQYCEYSTSMTEFLLKWLSREFVPLVFPDDIDFESMPRFKPQS